MLASLLPVLRPYGRAFLSQGAGLIGLAWCLAVGQAGFAVLLTVLVLSDQAVLLRGRFADGDRHRFLEGWCALVCAFAVLLCFAALIRSIGLRDGADGAVTVSPLDSLAYVVACFAHGPTSLTPISAVGRLAGAVLAALGALAFLAGLASLGNRLRHRG